MKNLFKESEFMLGVTKFNNLPDDVGDEILLAGRSNAGKSSALNALTGNPKLARISKTPGRTTEINFFKDIYKSHKKNIKNNNKDILIYQIIRDSIDLMVRDLIKNIKNNLRTNKVKSLKDV